MTIWFSSDLHLSHFNIIKYCNRPFRTIAEMNDAIIANFNKSIQPSDSIYILGDFSMGGKVDYVSSLFTRINGKKHFIFGNHDNQKVIKALCELNVIDSCQDTLGITINGQYIWLSHFPHRSWDQSCKGSWHLYGHVHGRLDAQPYGLSLDVGVDSWGFCPVSFQQLKIKFDEMKDIITI